MVFRKPKIPVFLSVLILILIVIPGRVESGTGLFSSLFCQFDSKEWSHFKGASLDGEDSFLLEDQQGVATDFGGGNRNPKKYIREKGFVKKVLDGDTVVLENGEKVRYIGVDTPELRRLVNGIWVLNPEPFGPSAFRFNQKMVENRWVYLEFDEVRRDPHNRLLAYLFVDGVMVNGLLVQEGLASVSLYPPNTRHADVLLAKQLQAWKQRKGFWKNPLMD